MVAFVLFCARFDPTKRRVPTMKIALITLMCVPGLAFAAGSDSSTPKPPTTTQTTQSCTGVQVWDSSKKKNFLGPVYRG